MKRELPFCTQSFDVHVFTDRTGMLRWSFTLPGGTRTRDVCASLDVVELLQADAMEAKEPANLSAAELLQWDALKGCP